MRFLHDKCLSIYVGHRASTSIYHIHTQKHTCSPECARFRAKHMASVGETEEDDDEQRHDHDQQHTRRRSKAPVLIKQIRIVGYADLSTVENEIHRLLKCDKGRRHPCLQSAAYIQFRQDMLHAMMVPAHEQLSQKEQRTVAKVYLPQGLVALGVIFEEKCSIEDGQGGPRREGIGVQLLWRPEFYEPASMLDGATTQLQMQLPPQQQEDDDDDLPCSSSSTPLNTGNNKKRKRHGTGTGQNEHGSPPMYTDHPVNFATGSHNHARWLRTRCDAKSITS